MREGADSGSKKMGGGVEVGLPIRSKNGLLPSQCPGTLIKKKIKFSSYKRKIQSGTVAKSYMRKGFLIYEEMRKIFPHK
jgi:hypothetical protein